MTPARRGSPARVTVSVVVPCAASHVGLLADLVRAIETQTRPPQELVIVVSGSTPPPKLRSDRLALSLAYSPRSRNAAQNRNRGSATATGSIVVFQDADDLPHPQRFEIIASIFETFAIEHLMHTFFPETQFEDWRRGRYALDYALGQLRSMNPYQRDVNVTNGNPAVSRALLQQVFWPENEWVGEDVTFNRRACAAGRSAVLSLPLLMYRQRLSAGR